MDRTERFYKIEKMNRARSASNASNASNARSAISFEDLLAGGEVSPATLKPDLQYLRSRMDAPIVYGHFDNGYQLHADPRDKRQVNHRLARVWFSESELPVVLRSHPASMRPLHHTNPA